MLTLRNDQLRFAFPDIHPMAGCHLTFHRTLRVPDDGHVYPLPPGLRYERYLGIEYTVTGTAPTTGKVTAVIIPQGAPTNAYFPDGSSISV